MRAILALLLVAPFIACQALELVDAPDLESALTAVGVPSDRLAAVRASARGDLATGAARAFVVDLAAAVDSRTPARIRPLLTERALAQLGVDADQVLTAGDLLAPPDARAFATILTNDDGTQQLCVFHYAADRAMLIGTRLPLTKHGDTYRLDR